jgi:hypothetical protein
MRQLDLLEARRRVLLQRCEQQRADISFRFERLAPAMQLSHWASRAHSLTRSSLAPTALFWGATILATVLMLRPGKMIGKVAWLTSAVTLVARATHLMRLLAQVRDIAALFRHRAGSQGG